MFLYNQLNYPQVPEELIDKPNFDVSEFSGQTDMYRWLPDMNNHLKTWLKENIPVPHNPAYHILLDGVPVHIDIARTRCINYVITSGGGVTYFTDSSGKSIMEFDTGEKRWHELNVSRYHGVKNIVGYRYAITLTPLDAVLEEKDWNYSKL